MAASLDRALAQNARAVEIALTGLLKSRNYPLRLQDAMLYAVTGPAKRVRPFLLMESARLFGAPHELSLPAALGLECVHCYSLVHDDLPCMDNDALRRGRPTLHVAYDEATAILAGDALLTLAFEILGTAEAIPPDLRLWLMNELSFVAGASGMAAGQMLDLAAEGRFEKSKTPLQLDETQVFDLQSRKTGALVCYAVRAGTLLGAASPEQLTQLTRYGETLGLLYQLADDLLDATGSIDKAGKAVAKDQKAGKATFVSLLGVEVARAMLEKLVTQAQAALTGLDKTENLKALPVYLAARVSE
jgi:farnesyl diphosphate synthase